LRAVQSSLWRKLVAVLRKRGFYFVVEPFITYAKLLKNVDPEELFETSPSKFYSLVEEYFRGDREAAYFFIDYLLSVLIPGDYELRREIIECMRRGDDDKVRELLASSQ